MEWWSRNHAWNNIRFGAKEGLAVNSPLSISYSYQSDSSEQRSRKDGSCTESPPFWWVNSMSWTKPTGRNDLIRFSPRDSLNNCFISKNYGIAVMKYHYPCQIPWFFQALDLQANQNQPQIAGQNTVSLSKKLTEATIRRCWVENDITIWYRTIINWANSGMAVTESILNRVPFLRPYILPHMLWSNSCGNSGHGICLVPIDSYNEPMRDLSGTTLFFCIPKHSVMPFQSRKTACLL